MFTLLCTHSSLGLAVFVNKLVEHAVNAHVKYNVPERPFVVKPDPEESKEKGMMHAVTSSVQL
jgi:hypothetical protein